MSPQALISLLILLFAVIAMSQQRVGPSALAPQSLLFRFAMKHFVHDPGATTAKLASPDGGATPYYIDMKGVMKVALSVAPSVVAGLGITLVRVFASTDIAGAVDATLVRTSGAIQLDNVDGAANSGGDVYRTEIHGQEIAQLATEAGKALRYLTVEITTSDATDEATVEALIEGMFQFENQSATVQA